MSVQHPAVDGSETTVEREAQSALRCYQQGRLTEARQRCVEALRIEAHAGLLHLLALVDYQEGFLDAAMRHAEEALGLRPDSAPVLNTLGAVCRRRGDELTAEQFLRRAVEHDPGLAQAHFNLASLLQRRGAWTEAREHYQQALHPGATVETGQSQANFPDDADILGHLPGSLPPDLAARQGWLTCLLARAQMPLSPEIRCELERCFDFAGLDLQGAGMLVLQSLKHDRSWPDLQAAARAGDTTRLRALSPALWNDRLLQRALRLCICTDPEIEEVLTAWRRTLALQGLEGYEEFALSLALHCRNNEFVFAVTPQEEEFLKAISGQAASRQIMAMYTSSQLKTGGLRQRAEQLPSITPIRDGVSNAVRGQYEEHPYPRWLSLHRHSGQPLADVVERACGVRPQALEARPCQLLVAGCGTGKAALSLATQIVEAEVLAVDLSRASLAYAQEMAERLGIRNVSFGHGDILELEGLNQRFHVIDCSGVLHHMADPLRGWRVLRGLLVPGGVMRVGLYSHRARLGVSQARALALATGGSDASAIRAWRKSVQDLPLEHPARAVLKVEDFYSTSMCRDLAFHVQEQTFDISRIGQMLEELGLELLGFELREAAAQATFTALFGEEDARARPALWEAFENLYPETFLGMYLFWCRCRP